ncbi:MAG: adenylate/guanylate cyclase domain-containing protein, partial [Pseudomonadota bacterium]
AVASVWLGLLNVELVGAYAPLIPASWLLVIVLAFGTLRYNPALQAWLTALSAVLMALTVWHTDGFLGGDWILDADAEAKVFMVSPPTAMRIVMLAAAGLVMTLAVWRARQMLVRALDSAARRQNLRRYLPHQISDMLEDGDIGVLRSGRRGQMTILFLDIRGFTAMSEKMMPEALATFMTGFRDLVTRTADAHNGIVDKFVGDGAMVVFGLQQQRARDPMDALACAEALAAAADDSDPPMRLAIGIHAGEVFCGAVGAESRLEFTVLGDVVNIASRLEGAAKSNDLPIVASADVIAAAGVEAGTWRSLGARQIRGRAEPLALFTPA